MCNINYTWILQLPHTDGSVEDPEIKNQTLCLFHFDWSVQISVVRAEILWYKNFSFSGQTSLAPIVLTSWGHVVSTLHIIVGKKARDINIFQFLFIWIHFSASFLFKNLTIVLSVFPSLWQATIRDLSRLISISCRRRSMKFSRSFGATELGMPEKSKHSLLVYCSSLWCCLSSSVSLLLIVLKASSKIFEAFCATETRLVNSPFFFASESILDVISNSFFDMSLFCCKNHFVDGLYCLVMPRKMLLNSHCSLFPTVI